MTPFQRKRYFDRQKHSLAVTVRPLTEALSRLKLHGLYFLPNCQATWLKGISRLCVWL